MSQKVTRRAGNDGLKLSNGDFFANALQLEQAVSEFLLVRPSSFLTTVSDL